MDKASSEKVLIIEDSKAFAAILKNLITDNHGFESDIAESMEDTKAFLAERASEYFIAIVDYHLPDAPNGEVIDIVIQQGIPTIVFTGTSDDSVSKGLWQKGIADYAHKHGTHNLEHVVWMVKRIYTNRQSEVLVVDNNTVSSNLIASLLETQNFIVHRISNASDAITFLEENQQIHLVVVSDSLHGLNGLELIGNIREKCPRAIMEVIGISAQSGRNLSAQFIKSGASDFVAKPLIPEEFLCRVNTAIDRIDSYFELDKLNKLKNQFLGTAAHDIRGPLGAIKTASDFLLKGSASEKRSAHLLNMINNNSTDLLNLLETLLDISVIESGEPVLKKQAIDTSEILMERLELYQTEANTKDISIECNIDEKVIATLDPLKIKQVFDNLITNAIKYSLSKSTITLTLKDDDKCFTLSIQDGGPGINEQEQKQLFKAFSVLSTQTTGGEKKTGLGLAITKSIVDAHDGKIYYEHTPTCHSTFFVKLPKIENMCPL